jgi:hypothetical protein
MKLEFARSGGFAGMHLSLVLDTDDLPAGEAAHLARLLETARSALTDTARSHPAPDRFQYDLTIESGQSRIESHTLCEPDVPESVRPLIEQLTAMARRSRT